MIDAIRSTASGFIFTTSLPPVITAAAKASIIHLKNSEEEDVHILPTIARVKRPWGGVVISSLIL